MGFTITDIKKHLGPGLGLRKNRYMIEIPVPGMSGESINVLCQSAGLPERNISTTELWHKGRKYVVRGETDYVGEYEINIVDDDQMKIRQMFDIWMKKIDDSRPDKGNKSLGASFESMNPSIINEIAGAVSVVNKVKNVIENPKSLVNFALNIFDDSKTLADYQTDINIWQMGNGKGSDSDKVYGYKLQNAFPKSIGIVTLEDGEENTLSEFSVTFAFSEFIPVKGTARDITSALGLEKFTELYDFNSL